MNHTSEALNSTVPLGIGLVSLQRTFAKRLAVPFSEEHSNTDQWCVLAAIAKLASPTMSDLALESGLANATLTRTVDSLVNNALVFRLADKGDRRRINVYLSDFGRQRLNRLNDIADASEKALADEIGDPLLGRLRRCVDQTIIALSND
ncbi:MarR family winged helix-turn-helix transcriptional regulator [Spelaeicoccus albus]|uniref:DNA-binding MarR family transcriptional regulator n=1 Tax=Spelaeicoccus albus TaxID=1280376 RepID=A0A7Z0IJ53_9MICO|nr:MarR family transcriptional regulator [Spelaeicoccus albus]NYI69067.1 DNA-binding MarR family transcriptional regulator [Spelaeicoccus albus]